MARSRVPHAKISALWSKAGGEGPRPPGAGCSRNDRRVTAQDSLGSGIVLHEWGPFAGEGSPISAAMLIRVSDPSLTGDLVRFLRGHDYLAVQKGRDTVEAAPINSVSARADRKRLRRELDEWLSGHPGASAEILGSR